MKSFNWQVLNNEWRIFGDTMVHVDYTTLNKNDISYEDIAATEAEVLIISCAYDPNIGWEFTDSEIEAIEKYVLEGHGLIVTAGTLYSTVPNNNKLASLFGMRDDIVYDVDGTPSLNLLDPSHQLFFNIPDPYQMATDTTCTPPDLSWDADDITEGTYVALSPDGMGAIIVNNGLAYITHWIEYQSNSDDKQLLYNAMIWSRYEQVDHDVAVLDLRAPDFIKPGEQGWVGAGGTIFDRDIVLKYKFDPNISSGEDTELSYRLKMAGYRLGQASIGILHLHRMDFRGWAKQRRRAESRLSPPRRQKPTRTKEAYYGCIRSDLHPRQRTQPEAMFDHGAGARADPRCRATRPLGLQQSALGVHPGSGQEGPRSTGKDPALYCRRLRRHRSGHG